MHREREAAGPHRGELDQIGDESVEATGFLLDDDGCPLRIARAVGDRLGVAADRREGRAQVVGDRQEELLLECLRTFERTGHRVHAIG